MRAWKSRGFNPFGLWGLNVVSTTAHWIWGGVESRHFPSHFYYTTVHSAWKQIFSVHVVRNRILFFNLVWSCLYLVQTVWMRFLSVHTVLNHTFSVQPVSNEISPSKGPESRFRCLSWSDCGFFSHSVWILIFLIKLSQLGFFSVHTAWNWISPVNFLWNRFLVWAQIYSIDPV